MTWCNCLSSLASHLRFGCQVFFFFFFPTLLPISFLSPSPAWRDLFSPSAPVAWTGQNFGWKRLNPPGPRLEKTWLVWITSLQKPPFFQIRFRREAVLYSTISPGRNSCVVCMQWKRENFSDLPDWVGVDAHAGVTFLSFVRLVLASARFVWIITTI